MPDDLALKARIFAELDRVPVLDVESNVTNEALDVAEGTATYRLAGDDVELLAVEPCSEGFRNSRNSVPLALGRGVSRLPKP